MIDFDTEEYNLDELEYLKKTMEYLITTLCDGCTPEESCLVCKWHTLTDDAEVNLFALEQELLKRKGESK